MDALRVMDLLACDGAFFTSGMLLKIGAARLEMIHAGGSPAYVTLWRSHVSGDEGVVSFGSKASGDTFYVGRRWG